MRGIVVEHVIGVAEEKWVKVNLTIRYWPRLNSRRETSRVASTSSTTPPPQGHVRALLTSRSVCRIACSAPVRLTPLRLTA